MHSAPCQPPFQCLNLKSYNIKKQKYSKQHKFWKEAIITVCYFFFLCIKTPYIHISYKHKKKINFKIQKNDSMLLPFQMYSIKRHMSFFCILMLFCLNYILIGLPWYNCLYLRLKELFSILDQLITTLYQIAD